MRRLTALLLPLAMLSAFPAAGQVVDVEVEEQVLVESSAVPIPDVSIPRGIAAFGPFRVLDNSRAALVDATDGRAPAQFAAMMRAFPGIATLEMIECPGTEDDRANLQLGRMIRAHGLATHVPDGGSVRSGAVELFLAGVVHTAEPRAEFAVHAWEDDEGRQPEDYPANAPENRAYIDYYRQMGMSTGEATAFYAMTNSVPNEDARWLTTAEMALWVRVDGPEQRPALAGLLASAPLDSARLLH